MEAAPHRAPEPGIYEIIKARLGICGCDKAGQIAGVLLRGAWLVWKRGKRAHKSHEPGQPVRAGRSQVRWRAGQSRDRVQYWILNVFNQS